MKDVTPIKFYRKELTELKNYGTIICFEAFIPKIVEKFKSNYLSFTIFLRHDPHVTNKGKIFWYFMDISPPPLILSLRAIQ